MRERRDLTALPESVPTAGGRERSGRVVLARIIGPKSIRRRLIAVAAASLVLMLLGWTFVVLAGRAVSWLRDQPEFTIPFEGVELMPAPPDAIRFGRPGIFSRVREKAKIDGPIRFLDQDLRELGLAFAKHSPWIARVDRVERGYPRRVLVRVTYRTPVARIDFDPTQNRFVAIADDGVVIPGEEVKPSVAAALLRLKGFASPPNDLPGHYLGADRDGNVPREIAAAVALARFLHDGDGADGQPPRIASVNLSQGPGMLLARTKRGMWVRWRNAPGEEEEDEPKAVEKLERLIQWEDANRNEPFTDEDCLVFDRTSARLKRPDKPDA